MSSFFDMVMLQMRRPMSIDRSDARHMLQETSTNVAIIVSLCFVVDVARNMVSMLRWESPSPNRMSELRVYIFFSGVASIEF